MTPDLVVVATSVSVATLAALATSSATGFAAARLPDALAPGLPFWPADRDVVPVVRLREVVFVDSAMGVPLSKGCLERGPSRLLKAPVGVVATGCGPDFEVGDDERRTGPRAQKPRKAASSLKGQ
jgi:hypothetical protein